MTVPVDPITMRPPHDSHQGAGRGNGESRAPAVQYTRPLVASATGDLDQVILLDQELLEVPDVDHVPLDDLGPESVVRPNQGLARDEETAPIVLPDFVSGRLGGVGREECRVAFARTQVSSGPSTA